MSFYRIPPLGYYYCLKEDDMAKSISDIFHSHVLFDEKKSRSSKIRKFSLCGPIEGMNTDSQKCYFAVKFEI